MKKKPIGSAIKIGMFLLVLVMLSIGIYAQTDVESKDTGVSSLMFDVPDTAAYKNGELDADISNFMFDKDDLAFHPDFKIRVNEIYIRAGLSPLYPDVASGLGSGLRTQGLVWIAVILAVGLLFYWRSRNKGVRPLNPKKHKSGKIFNTLKKNVKKLGLRLIDLFTGSHLREQKQNIQNILTISSELHSASEKKDIYFIEDVVAEYKRKNGKDMLDELKKAVVFLIGTDEKVLGLIETLFRKNKQQKEVFIKEEFSGILKKELRTSLFETYSEVERILKEMKEVIATRLYGNGMKGDEGLHRLLMSINEIKKRVSNPKSDKNAVKISSLTETVVNETKKMQHALETTERYIAKFDKIFRKDIEMGDEAEKERISKAKLGGKLLEALENLKPLADELKKGTDIKNIKYDRNKANDFAKVIESIIDIHPEKNHETAIRVYLAMAHGRSTNDINEAYTKSVLKLYGEIKKIRKEVLTVE